jgi:hypothetical protein
MKILNKFQATQDKFIDRNLKILSQHLETGIDPKHLKFSSKTDNTQSVNEEANCNSPLYILTNATKHPSPPQVCTITQDDIELLQNM